MIPIKVTPAKEKATGVPIPSNAKAPPRIRAKTSYQLMPHPLNQLFATDIILRLIWKLTEQFNASQAKAERDPPIHDVLGYNYHLHRFGIAAELIKQDYP